MTTKSKLGKLDSVLLIFESVVMVLFMKDANVVDLQLKRSVVRVHHSETDRVNLGPAAGRMENMGFTIHKVYKVEHWSIHQALQRPEICHGCFLGPYFWYHQG